MHNIFEWIIEAIGWLKITLSPFCIGLLIGLGIYLINHHYWLVSCMIAMLGLIAGGVIATRIWKSPEGTTGFLSRVSLTDDLTGPV